MVRWAGDRIRDGHMPFDGWYPYLSLGASRFHHYQSLPHIVTGTISLAGGDVTFRWSLYLLLACWPVSVYAGGRLLGLGRWPAAAAAAVSPLLSSEPGLGYEWGSYVWRGSGTWAQLWGMWALPFAWGLGWRAVSTGKSLWLAALALALTICFHLLTGYLALCCIPVFALVAPRQLLPRLGRAAIVVGGGLLASSWMLVPLIADAGWTVNDEFSRGTIYYDSFGARQILTWLGTGGIFDRGRLPVVTALVGVGLVFAIVQARRREPARVLIGLALVSLLLFFGRPTLGPVIDLLPGGPDLFLRRFISGVHLAGIYLAGTGMTLLAVLASRLVRRWTPSRRRSPAIVVAVVAVLAAFLLAPAVIERFRYERQGARWIDEQAAFEATDGVGFEALVERARSGEPGRIFSEMRGPAASRYRIGQVPSYAALLNLQVDAIGFTRPTWSMASPAEYRFDGTSLDHRRLFGVRYVIRPQTNPLPDAQPVARAGRHLLYEMADVRYLEVVDTIAPVAADRRNLGQQTASILDSGLFARRYLPTIAFGSAAAAEPTLGADELPGRAGDVLSAAAEPQAGTFAGTVDLSREAAVLFKVSFDPRFSATVDGVEVPTEMLAPAFVGVRVPEGRHEVALSYEPFPFTGPLIALGILAIVGLWFVGSRGRRRARTGASHRTATSAVAALVIVGLAGGASSCGEAIDPDLALREGIALEQAGDARGASEQYRAVLDARPGDEEANYRLGAIEHDAGRVALAERYWRAALDADPGSVPALSDLAMLRADLGATQEAIDLLERVVTAAPDDARAHLRLGLLYRDANEMDLAVSHLETAVSLDPRLGVAAAHPPDDAAPRATP